MPNVFYSYESILIVGEALKTIISVQKEGKYYVVTDFITSVADQGKTEEETISLLKQGLEEHYQLLLELAPKGSKTSINGFLDEVNGKKVSNSSIMIPDIWLAHLTEYLADNDAAVEIITDKLFIEEAELAKIHPMGKGLPTASP